MALLPGSTIGILGSGQLGRMLALAARRMDYRVYVLSPEADSPTGQVADREFVAAYHDLEAVRQFAQGVDVVTYEFENVPAPTAAVCAEYAPVHPGPQALHVAQNRLREKQFCASRGLPVTPFYAVNSTDDLRAGLAFTGLPAVIKTAESGYDGKGQFKITTASEIEAAWDSVGRREAILEGFVPYERELSVVSARGVEGQFAHFGAIENHHRRHILDVSIAPAPVMAGIAAEAVEMAREVLEALDVAGVLCVEFFLTADNRLLINEIAPRPHNSGHLTIDAVITSQFEQQLRAVCGLPLGDTSYLSPAAMVNLLGDLWQDGPPDWSAAAAFPSVKLHLYGKRQARPGRKMGHLTALAPVASAAVDKVISARRALGGE
ncbi:MAG: 5-(carboxyamino)imidazole ribonucleotide synthase [Candidatus Promineifilaceae bacterium]